MDSTATSIITKIAADQVLINEITIGGFLLSLLGLAFVILQIRRTRQVAEAARSAALNTRIDLQKNVLLAEISGCIRLIEQVKSYTREGNFEGALLRITDLRTQLCELRNINGQTEASKQIPFKDILTQLFIISDEFENRVQNSEYELVTTKINKILTKTYLKKYYENTKLFKKINFLFSLHCFSF